MYSAGPAGGTRGYKLYNESAVEIHHVDKSNEVTYPPGNWYTDIVSIGAGNDEEVWTVVSDNSNRLRFGLLNGVPPMVSQGVGRFPEWAKTEMCRDVHSDCEHSIQCGDGFPDGTMSCNHGKCQYDACIPPSSGDWTPQQDCTFVDEIHQLYGDWIIGDGALVPGGVTMRLEGTTRFGFGGTTQKIRIKESLTQGESGGKLVLQDTAKLGGCNAELAGERLYLPFEEGTGSVVADWSGFENNATTSDGTWISAPDNRGYALDGGITIVPDDNSLDLQGGAFTVAMWVNKTVSTVGNGWTDTAGVNKWNTAGNSEWALTIGDNNSNVPHFFIESSSTAYNAGNTTALSLNTWQHLVGVFDGTNLKLYIDGTEESSNNIGVVTMNTIPGRSLYIGGVEGNVAMSSTNTIFDEVRVFNRALSEVEIVRLGNHVPSQACVQP